MLVIVVMLLPGVLVVLVNLLLLLTAWYNSKYPKNRGDNHGSEKRR